MHDTAQDDLALQRLSSFLRHVPFLLPLITPAMVPMVGKDRLHKPVEADEIVLGVDPVEAGHQHSHERFHFFLAPGGIRELGLQQQALRAEKICLFLLRPFALNLIHGIDKLADLAGPQADSVGEEFPHFLCQINQPVRL